MSGWNKKLEGLQLNPEESLHSLEFATSQEAWEKLNEGFLRLEPALFGKGAMANSGVAVVYNVCLLYTSDAADDLLCVELGGCRIIKKKNITKK